MRRHVTIEDIYEIIIQTDAGCYDEIKSTDDDLYMTYRVCAREDGTLVDYMEADKTFYADLVFENYRNICCNELYDCSYDELNDGRPDNDPYVVDFGSVCDVLEDPDYWLFRNLCEDLARQVNEWLDSLDEDEDED